MPLDQLPEIIVETSSGNRCRITFEERDQAIAGVIHWPNLAATPQDHAEAEAAAMMMMEGRLDPRARIMTANMQTAPKAAVEAAVKRFLASDEN